MHVRAASFPGSPLSLRFSRIVWAGCLKPLLSSRLGGSFRRECSRAKEPVSKNDKLLVEVVYE